MEIEEGRSRTVLVVWAGTELRTHIFWSLPMVVILAVIVAWVACEGIVGGIALVIIGRSRILIDARLRSGARRRWVVGGVVRRILAWWVVWVPCIIPSIGRWRWEAVGLRIVILLRSVRASVGTHGRRCVRLLLSVLILTLATCIECQYVSQVCCVRIKLTSPLLLSSLALILLSNVMRSGAGNTSSGSSFSETSSPASAPATAPTS